MEQTIIKRQALEKLDKLIQAELDRLFALSSGKAIYEQFELVIPDGYYTEEEKKLISSNIKNLQNIKKYRTLLKRAIVNLKNTILLRELSNPWITNQDNPKK